MRKRDLERRVRQDVEEIFWNYCRADEIEDAATKISLVAKAIQTRAQKEVERSKEYIRNEYVYFVN